MYKKNRFSILLEQLMTTAELKNYTLAQALGYDVSYISKWVSGRMLPSEKNMEKVLKEISYCIVDSLNEKSRAIFYADYQVDQSDDLKDAIYDNMVIEYNYVKDLQNTSGSGVAPKVSYYPELTLVDFISKMKHPALRKVKSLEVLSLMDILDMEHEYRLMITEIETEHMSMQRDYPGVQFSMVINLEAGKRDYIYDAIFLINVLTNRSNVELQLYGNEQAYGKAVFVVKDIYSIAGMLINQSQCMSVTTSEDSEKCAVLYQKIKSLCCREKLLFRKISMKDMLNNYDYIQSMISTGMSWLLGRMTEHFLTDELFEQVFRSNDVLEEVGVEKAKLWQIHSLTKSVLQESQVRIMIYESALTDFAVSGKLEFYNCKVTLSIEQRCQYIQNILELLEKNDGIEIKLVCGRFVRDFQYIVKPCVFISDTISYLRLEQKNHQNKVAVLNGPAIKTLFDRFYYEIWNNQENIVLEDRSAIKKSIHHVIQSIELLSRMG